MNLKKYNRSVYYGYRWLVDNLEKAVVPDGFFLSSLGARICYSSKNPLILLKTDERIKDPSKRFNFLRKLFDLGHFSVFAHSPVFFNIEDFNSFSTEDYIDLIRLFKGWNCGQSFCFNVRHLVEAFRKESLSFDSLVTDTYSKTQKIDLCFYFSQNGGLVEYHLNDLPELEPEKSFTLCFVIKYEIWEWFSFVVHGCSRVFTHQLVRHTWLNFSQRSNRHTKVKDVVVPKGIKKIYPPFSKPLERIYQFYTNDILNKYESLLSIGVPKEDARFIAPEGSMTTIMASGPRFVWEDFVEKRLNKKAQWEIRGFAEIVKNVLSKMKEVNNE